MHCPCGADRTIICLNALAQIVSEILPKNCFSRFYTWCSRKMLRLLQFLCWRAANGLVRKLMIFRKISRAIFWISIFIHEKMAPKVGTVGPKNGFSRFLFFRDIEYGFSRVSIRPMVPEDTYVKFRMDPLSRLGCKRGQQTNKQSRNFLRVIIRVSKRRSNNIGSV